MNGGERIILKPELSCFNNINFWGIFKGFDFTYLLLISQEQSPIQ